MEQSTLLSGSLFLSVCQLSGRESNSDQRKTWSKAFLSLSLFFSFLSFRQLSGQCPLSLFLSPSCPFPKNRMSTFIPMSFSLQSPLTSWPIYLSINWTRKTGPRGNRYPPSLFCRLVHYPAKPYLRLPKITTYFPDFWPVWQLPPRDPLFSLRSQIATSQLPGWLS